MTVPMQHLPRRELAQLLASIPDRVIVVDRERKVRYMNRPGAGYEIEDVIGMDILEFVEPARHDELLELYARAAATGEAVAYEIAILDSDGGTEWHEGTISPIVSDGQIEGYAVVTRDVTARHLAEEEAEKLRSLVPVCSWCHKIRDDEGYWQRLEEYIEETTTSKVTHGMCAECEAEMLDGSAAS